MKQLSVLGMLVVASALIAAVLLGSGTASAAFSGKTYAVAAASITSNGGKVAIATVIGDQLPTDECIVTGDKKASNLDSSGSSRGYLILLDLNCNRPLAGPGKPGNSAASATGAEAKKVMGWIDAWNKGSGIGSCIGSADKAQWCLAQCDKYGTCSADTVQTFSSQT